MKITVFVVFICATAFNSSAAYSEEKVVKLIRSVPLEERKDFIKYALVKGQERDQGKRQEGIPKTFSDILTFYRIHNSANLLGTPRVGEIVCFPWGCIDINDPSVYP